MRSRAGDIRPLLDVLTQRVYDTDVQDGYDVGHPAQAAMDAIADTLVAVVLSDASLFGETHCGPYSEIVFQARTGYAVMQVPPSACIASR